MKHKVVWLALIGLGGGLSLVSYSALRAQEQPLTQLAQSTLTAPLTPTILGNLEYQVPQYGVARMTNGRYEQNTVNANERWTAGVMNMTASGDLNQDGTEDAVVLLWANGGGSGQFEYLAAVLNQSGNPKNVATALLGDRVEVMSIEVRAKQIRVDLITQGLHDPMCCPTLEVVQTYELQGDTLKLISQQEIGTRRQTSQLEPFPASDLLILPGERVGQVTAKTTFSELVSLFGADKLTNQAFSIGEGEQQPATRVNLGNERSFTVIWTDENRTEAAAVSQLGTAWRTPEGIGTGTSLAELQEKLGPFQLYGFGWDYSGTVILKETLLAKYQRSLVLRLSPDSAATESRSEDLQAVLGEGPFDSTNPHLQVLSPRVERMIVRLAQPK
jgi:hypothetical protein